jgi:RHS repeat-associated protein
VLAQIVNYLYDGEGHRVAMQSNVSGTTTLTAYISSIEEMQTSGTTTQTTTYYTVGKQRIAADVNGTFYYFGYDALGSQVAVLNASGSLVGAQLYGPYGASRYTTGTIPTSIGFTGQQSDSVTGLDYYGARYYDELVGVFLAADDVQGNRQGMEPYAYVGGNPETMVDPTGQFPLWFAAATIVAVVAACVIVAAASPVVVAVAAGIAMGYVASVGIDLLTNGIPKNEQDLDEIGVDALASEAAGAVGGYYSAPASVDLPEVVEGEPDTLWARMDANKAQQAAKSVAIKSGIKGGVLAPAVGFLGKKLLEKGKKLLGNLVTSKVAHAAVRKTPAPKRTYTYKSTHSYSSWTQTSSSYNSYTQSNYSYSDTVYHYTDPSYNYSVFSSSNGDYERSNGRTRMS